MEMNLKINVAALPPIQRNLLLVLPALAIAGLFIYFLIMPTLEEKKLLTDEVEKQKAEIATLQKDAAKLPSLLAENKRLESKLSDLQLQLPEEKEVSGLLRQVSELGIKSGLQISVWRPQGRNIHPSNEIYEIPVAVEMRGGYHMFGQFFSNITKLKRIVNILNITMRVGAQKKRETGTNLNVSFISMTYSQIPEPERKELQKKSDKGKKK